MSCFSCLWSLLDGLRRYQQPSIPVPVPRDPPLPGMREWRFEGPMYGNYDPNAVTWADVEREDWFCPACGQDNWQTRAQCRTCYVTRLL